MTLRVLLLAAVFTVLVLLPLLLLGGCAAKAPTLGTQDAQTIAWMKAHGYTW